MASTGNQVSEAWHSHSKNEVDLCARGKNHLGGVIIRGEKLDWRMGFRRQPHEQEPRGRRATIMDELRQSRKLMVDVSSNQERGSEWGAGHETGSVTLVLLPSHGNRRRRELNVPPNKSLEGCSGNGRMATSRKGLGDWPGVVVDQGDLFCIEMHE